MGQLMCPTTIIIKKKAKTTPSNTTHTLTTQCGLQQCINNSPHGAPQPLPWDQGDFRIFHGTSLHY